MNVQEVKEHVLNKFEKINSQLYTCTDDVVLNRLFLLLEIKQTIVENTKAEIDFATSVCICSDLDIDCIFIIYAGAVHDSGFICFYLPNIVVSKSNLLSILNFIQESQPKINIQGLKQNLHNELEKIISSTFSNSKIEIVDGGNLFYLKFK